MKKQLMALLCAALLSACVTAGTKVDTAKASAFEKGRTTYSEVVSALGSPNSEATANDGTRTIVYSYTKASPRAQDFIPYVGLFISKSDVNSQIYTFGFDRAGVLQSVTNGMTQATANYGLLK
jgi:outer membrane protein assembly factor BamE (lipoprotein component of BamABCDE complex)